jgi:hypothetical protein
MQVQSIVADPGVYVQYYSESESESVFCGHTHGHNMTILKPWQKV